MDDQQLAGTALVEEQRSSRGLSGPCFAWTISSDFQKKMVQVLRLENFGDGALARELQEQRWRRLDSRSNTAVMGAGVGKR